MSAREKSAVSRLIKVSAEGLLLAADAADWSGVYIPAAQLIVARRPTTKALGFKAANAACAEIDLCGAKAERSISLREFVNHLLEDGRTAPALDPAYFTIDDPYQWIWTCDSCAPAGYAWGVNLNVGYSPRGHQGTPIHALAVRSGQFSGFGQGAQPASSDGRQAVHP